MDLIAARLRAVRADFGEWTVLAIFPLGWACQWWGNVGLIVGFFGVPLLACLAHWLLCPDIASRNPNEI